MAGGAEKDHATTAVYIARSKKEQTATLAKVRASETAVAFPAGPLQHPEKVARVVWIRDHVKVLV